MSNFQILRTTSSKNKFILAKRGAGIKQKDAKTSAPKAAAAWEVTRTPSSPRPCTTRRATTNGPARWNGPRKCRPRSRGRRTARRTTPSRAINPSGGACRSCLRWGGGGTGCSTITASSRAMTRRRDAARVGGRHRLKSDKLQLFVEVLNRLDLHRPARSALLAQPDLPPNRVSGLRPDGGHQAPGFKR